MSSDGHLDETDISTCVLQRSTDPVDSGHRADILTGMFRDQKVALKRLRGKGSTQRNWTENVQKRYIEHVKVWIQLAHENVVPVFGLAFDLGILPALVMPYYPDGSVMHRLSSGIEVSQDTRLSWLKDASSGLQYLHDFTPPVIHGDIRGANIYVDSGGHARIADYGMPFVLDESFWAEFEAIGPCRWTAPEVMDPSEDESTISKVIYTKNSDIYSFGMTILEVLTGKAPFDDKDHDLRVYTLVAAGKRPDIPSHLEDDIGALIQQCWAQDPADRPLASGVCQTLLSLTSSKALMEMVPP